MFSLYYYNKAIETTSGSRYGNPTQGAPNRLMDFNNSVSKIEASLIPTTEDAVAAYEVAGGQLTHCSEFGTDPLGHDPQRLQQLRSLFS